MMSETSRDEQNQNSSSPFPKSLKSGGRSEVEGIDLLDLLIMVAERKRIVLAVTAICFLLAILISLVLPVRYTATVTLLPPQQSTSMGAALASQLGNLGGVATLAGGNLGLKNPNDMYVSLLKTRTVEDGMVQRFNLMSEYKMRSLSGGRSAFEDQTALDGSGKDNLIRISVNDRDPRRAAELANGYVEQFRELSQHLAISEASQRRLFFERELGQAKDNLAAAEEALKQTELSTGVIQPESQARALIESAATLRAEITAREVQIQGMKTYATGENSQVIQAERELDDLRAQLTKLGGSEGSSGGEFIVPKGRVPETGMEYIRKLRDVKYYETIFDILARQYEVAKLDEAKQGALIQVVDPAVAPDIRSFPKRGRIVVFTTIAGFVLGILFALFASYFQLLKSNSETGRKISLLQRALAGARSSAS